MNKALLISLGIVNVPIYGFLASVIFGKEGIRGAICYTFIPDFISALRGEFWDDQWSQLMLIVWIIICVTLVWSEFIAIEKHFPEIFLFFSHLGMAAKICRIGAISNFLGWK